MPAERVQYKHNNQLIYEWDQSIDEVNIYFTPPPNVTAQHIDCKISTGHVKIGIKGNPPYIDLDLSAQCIVDESFWTFEDDEVHITLQKMRKADVWSCVFRGHDSLDAVETEAMKKKILLERFQEEHPGFDFSNAEVTGAVPDPRTFMRG